MPCQTLQYCRPNWISGVFGNASCLFRHMTCTVFTHQANLPNLWSNLKRSGRWGVARPRLMPTRSLSLLPGIMARGLHHVWQLQAALVFKVDTKNTCIQHSSSQQTGDIKQALPARQICLAPTEQVTRCPRLPLSVRPLSITAAGLGAGCSETKSSKEALSCMNKNRTTKYYRNII